MQRSAAILFLLALGAVPAAAQDNRAQDAIRIGVTYRPGTRPGLVVLPGPGLDSVRAIVRRDLDYSDQFQIIETGSGAGTGAVNYQYDRTQFGADHAVDEPAPVEVDLRLPEEALRQLSVRRVPAVPAHEAGGG